MMSVNVPVDSNMRVTFLFSTLNHSPKDKIQNTLNVFAYLLEGQFVLTNYQKNALALDFKNLMLHGYSGNV